MDYNEAKVLIGKIYTVDPEFHDTITELIKHAELKSKLKKWSGKGVAPYIEFRMYSVKAMKILAELADRNKHNNEGK